MFELLLSAYSTISTQDSAHFLGMNENDATNCKFLSTACMLVVVKFFFVYIRGLNELVSVIRNPCCVCKENRLHSLHCLADYNLDLIGQVSFHLSPLKVMLKCYFLNLLKRLSHISNSAL